MTSSAYFALNTNQLRIEPTPDWPYSETAGIGKRGEEGKEAAL